MATLLGLNGVHATELVGEETKSEKEIVQTHCLHMEDSTALNNHWDQMKKLLHVMKTDVLQVSIISLWLIDMNYELNTVAIYHIGPAIDWCAGGRYHSSMH